MKLTIKGEIRIPFTATVSGEAVTPLDVRNIQKEFRELRENLDGQADYVLRYSTDADSVTLRPARLELTPARAPLKPAQSAAIESKGEG